MRRSCCCFLIALLSVLAEPLLGQQLTLLGLRALNGAGAFHGLRHDAAGHLFTLFDAGDGIRLLEFSSDGTQVLAEAHIGSTGDSGIALDLDPAGNVYVAGTTNSLSSLAGTPGTAFPNRAGTRTNSFVARFSPQLQPQWLTFCGAEPLAVTGIAATPNAVFITGSIFSATLPVTSGGIQQSPAPNSGANGFVESFSAAAGTLQYATYLTGANGDTSPATIAADSSGNTYVAGSTSATGFPTTAALVPVFRAAGAGTASGFVTKLSPPGDGFLFSTFVPGNGLSSVALDSTGMGSLLLSGDVAPGLFPLTRAQVPIASQLGYQTAIRMALDGSAVLSSTLLAPATGSIVTPGPNGSVWVAGSAQNATPMPLMPVTPVETFGNAFALRLSSTGFIDRGTRFGGLPVANSGYASLPATEGGITVLPGGAVAVGGTVAPTLSSDLLASATYDLPLAAAPNAALSSTVRDALPAADCTGSVCSGTAGLLALLTPDSNAAALALSSDDLPNLTLRNLGTVSATGLQVMATGYTVGSDCRSTLAAGAECHLLLAGAGPGSITAQVTGGSAFTTSLPAATRTGRAIVVSPRELDFGIVTGTSAAVARTLTVTNLGTTTQTVNEGNTSSMKTAYSVAETGSTCTPSGTGTAKVLAPGSTCTITLAFAASADAGNDGAVNAHWQVGTTDVLLTGYSQAAALSVSASTIDFGRQFTGGLRTSRYLYVSNSGDRALAHTAIISPNAAFGAIDECAATLAPHSICRVALTYEAPSSPSSDATTLSVDGLPVTVLGETLPQPSLSGSSANPNLRVSPASISFSNAVAVTQASSETHAVTISNAGAVSFPLTLSAAGDFTFSTGCPAALGGGASCTAAMTFAPTADGDRQGLLAVTAGSSAPVYVALSGTGSSILPTGSGNLRFGDTSLGSPSVQWLKVAQAFPSLTVSSSDANFGVLLVEDSGFGHGTPSAGSYSSSVTGSCLNCYLGVQFSPTAAGTHAATITLASRGSGQATSLAASGTGVALTGLILTPTSQDFGSVPVHSSPASTVFQLTNGTNSPVTTNAVTFTGDFATTGETTGAATCNAGTLAPGAACLIPVRFSPSAPGPRTGSVTVSTSAGQAAAPLTGTGSSDPGIAFTPGELRFDNVPGGAAQQQAITVTNTSSNNLTVGTPVVSDAHFTFNTTCGTLAASASCTVIVLYAPGSFLANGQLSIPVMTAPAGGATNATYTIALSGLYSATSAGLQIVPGAHSTVNFGAAATGAPALTRILHVNNLAAQALAISVETPRQFAVTGSTCGTVAAGGGCDLAVQYTPLTTGDTTGTLLVLGSPADSSAAQTALGYLEGFGTGAAGSLSITGDLSPTGLLSFGQVASGQAVSRTLTVTNPVGAAATVTVRRIRSEQPFPSTSTCGAPLAAGQSCTVTLTYAPVFQAAIGSAQTGTEADTGTLMIESDGANAPQTIDLSGSVTPVFVTAPSNVAPIAAYTASQGSLTFTSTAVGTPSAAQPVTLTNTGTATLHFSQPVLSNGFTASTLCSSLVPGASCTLSVQYIPQSSVAALGALEMRSDASDSLEFISLLGSVQAQSPGPVQSITLSPQSLDFGRVLLRNTSSLLATVTNTGTLPVVLGARTVSGDGSFALAAASNSTPCPAAGSTLAAGASCTIALTFTPAATGTLRATLAVASSATAQPLTVQLSGVGTQPLLFVLPAAISFGDVAVGSTSTRAITLVNSSSQPVDGLSFLATAGFGVSSTCGITTLNANSSCAVSVTYAPAAAGVSSGALTISSTDPASPITVPLNGNGIQATGVTVSALSAAPSALNFGNVSIGGSATLSFVLSNATASTVSSLLLTASTGFTVTSECGTALDAYSTCPVLVTFLPSSAAVVTGSVTVQSANSTTPLQIALTGSGVQTVPQLSATPGALGFGSVPVGSSNTLAVTLTNTSSSPVNSLGLVTTGQFSVGGTCGSTLNAGASCSAVVSYAPLTAGAAAGTLTVRSTDATSPLTIALTGSGTVLPPRLVLTPPSLSFGTQPVGTSTTLTATLQNTNSAAVTSLTLRTTPGFSVASTCGSTLPAGSSCSVSVTFSPTIAGAASGLLTATSSDPASPLTASLTGVATVAAGASGSFTLTVNGGDAATASVQSGLPANFDLVVASMGGYTGTVALTCSADGAIAYAACSLVPPSVTLNGSSAASIATIATVSAVNVSQTVNPLQRRQLLWCLTPALLLLLPRRRLPMTLLALLSCILLTAVGCGSGGDPRIRYVSPGSYTFHVTATSTSGPLVAQSVTLTVHVTPR